MASSRCRESKNTEVPKLKNGQPEMVHAPTSSTANLSPKYLSKAGELQCIIVGNWNKFVKLPEHVDRNEWLATHCRHIFVHSFSIAHAVLAYEFFHLLNAYYGSIISSCTMETCPIMRIRTSSGLQALIWPPDFVTSTKEGHSSRSSMTTLFFSASNTLCREISATNYIDSALTWIETQLECTEKFPKAMKDEYPAGFERKLVAPIFQLLFHVFAHIYEFHYLQIVELGEEPYLNALLSHFITFGREFNLFQAVDLGPLGALVDLLFPPAMELVKPIDLSVIKLSGSNEHIEAPLQIQDGINVCLTGAAGQIAYALIPHLINGTIFKQSVNLKLLDIEPMEKVMEGVVMEIEDYASPNVNSIMSTSNPLVGFKDCDVAILVGAMPRKEGMQRKDLLKANATIFKIQGQALDLVAHKSVKVLVVGNPANTNAFIVSHYAKSIRPQNFSALTRLDHNRAHAQLAKKLGVSLDRVAGLVIWGNHSNTQVPDVTHVKIDGQPAGIHDRLGGEYVNGKYIPLIQCRGASVIGARKLSSAMSAAKAIADQLDSWLNGSDGYVSMAVISDGSYGSPSGTFFSFPCRCSNGEWEIVRGLELADTVKKMIEATSEELIAERDEANLCLIGSPDLEPL